MAIGRTPAGSFSSPISRAPQNYGRASAGSLPALKFEEKSAKACAKVSSSSDCIISTRWQGLRPEGPLVEAVGKDRHARLTSGASNSSVKSGGGHGNYWHVSLWVEFPELVDIV